MTIYQKAIKVRKVCISKRTCYGCDYFDYCRKTIILFNTPADESITTISKAIKEEKWDIK